MESIRLFFFKLRLIWTLSLELLVTALRICFGSLTFGVTGGLILVVYLSTMIDPGAIQVQSQTIWEKDFQRAETQINYWEGLASVSPTRDIFLNLSLLYDYLGEEEQAAQNMRRAFELDPNNSVFEDQSWLWETREASREGEISNF